MSASDDLKKIADQLDPLRGVRDAWWPASGIAAAARAGDQLKRMSRLRDALRLDRDALPPHSGSAAAFAQQQRLLDRALPDASFLRLLRQHDQQLATLKRMGRRFDDHFAQLSTMVAALRPAHALGDRFIAQGNQAAATARLIDNMRTLVEPMRQVGLPARYGHLDQQAARFSARAQVGALSTRALDQLVDDLAKGGAEAQLTALATVLRHVRDAEKSQELTWEHWRAIVIYAIPILLALWLHWDALQGSAAMERRLTASQSAQTARLEASQDAHAHARATEAQIAGLLETIETLSQTRPDPAGPQYVVVLDTVRIRKAPGGRDISRVHANQVLTATGGRGKWLRVRYFDYVDARMVEGWCRKKHLRPLDQ